ncbi:MAG TPA: HAMP domain-containing sensor histidine kinase [Bacillota bacterium]|nr:HAMP domain-containing sensor histidine kinase [Bacillota bacterium]
MLIIVILLTIMAVLLIISHPKSPTHWWGSAFLLFLGCGGLGQFLHDYFRLDPFAARSNFYHVYILVMILSVFYDFFAPYAFAMYSIYFSEVFSRFRRRLLAGILIIPVLIMCVLFSGQVFPGSKAHILFRPALAVWVTLYVFASNIILIYSFWKQDQGKIKQQKLLACLIVFPSTMAWVLNSYILDAYKIHGLYKYNYLIAGYAFLLFIGVILRYGFMGLKIKIEREYFENVMKATNLGTSLLSHTLKNEMAKMIICIHNIKYSINQSEQDIDQINTNIQIALNSLDYFREMADKINIHTREIVLNREYYSLVEIIDESLESVNIFLMDRNIEVINNIPPDISLYCDNIHIRETFNNLFRNAIEAMGESGKLEIGRYRERKSMVITIKDNGAGISKENLPLVFNPFFTTKKHGNNFGLGLSYCYNVIQKHGGHMVIQSENGIGTTVLIYFPITRVEESRFTATGAERVYLNW